MTLYIYLQAKPLQSVSFGSPLSAWLKGLNDEMVLVEVDNHSEAFLVNQCLPLIPKVDQVILHSEVQEGETLGALKSIFEKLRKIEKPILSITQGDHKGLTSMLKLMKTDSRSISNLTEAELIISEFLNLDVDSKS